MLIRADETPSSLANDRQVKNSFPVTDEVSITIGVYTDKTFTVCQHTSGKKLAFVVKLRRLSVSPGNKKPGLLRGVRLIK
jgi:hypothetical protein